MNDRREVRELLEWAAEGPVGPPPVAELVGRGARRLRTRQAMAVGLTVSVVAALISTVTIIATTDRASRHGRPTGPNGQDATAAQIAAGSWQALPAPPIDACGSARAVTGIGDVVVLVVSQHTSRCPSAAAAYEPGSNRWTELPEPPASLRGQLTVDGGLYVSRATGAAALLDPGTGTWQSLPAVPVTGSLATLVKGTVDPTLIGSGPDHDQAFSYNGTRWVSLPSLVHPGRAIVALAGYSDGESLWAFATEQRTTPHGFSSGLKLLRLDRRGWTVEPNLPERPAVVTSVHPIVGGRQVIIGGNCPPYASCPPSGIQLGIADLGRGHLEIIGQSPLGFGMDAAVPADPAIIGLDTNSVIGSGEPGQAEIRPIASTIFDVMTGRWLSGPRDDRLGDVTGMAWTTRGLVVLGSPSPACSCRIGGLVLRPATRGTNVAQSPYPGLSTTVAPPNLTPASWPTNAAGETYGSAAGITVAADLPDLIAVVATNGRAGYVRKAQWVAATQPTPPRNPRAATQGPPRRSTLRVYAADGHTQIGVFVTGSRKP